MNTSISAYYKKVSKLIANLAEITADYSVTLYYMNLKHESGDYSKSLEVMVHKHKHPESDSSIIFDASICDYNDDKTNKMRYKGIKECIENIIKENSN